jgi:hypothetical protein
MNAILKAVLLGLEHTAAATVPGGALVDTAVHEIVDHSVPREQGIVDAIQAGFSEIQTFKPEMIADPILFNTGVVEAHDAFQKIRASLVQATPAPAPAP